MTPATPDLSVVVPSVNGAGDLLGCLAALRRQEGADVEVLVPERCGEAVRAAVRARFPEVVLLPVPPDTSIPRMRALAFAAAHSDSVAVIEDHVLVPADWAAHMVRARTEGHQVVGGWVQNAATERIVDRAAYLCEYGHFLRPPASGPVDGVTGNNVVYERSLLERYREIPAAGRWEDRLHEAMRRDGVRLVSRPEIRVAHRKHYTVAEYAAQRFLYSRAYAGMRALDLPGWRRAGYRLATWLLFPVLLRRIVANGWAHPETRRDLVLSLPLLVVFCLSWTLGEIVGAWLGAGDSLQRVR